MIDTHSHLYLPQFARENQPAKSMQGQCEAVDRAVNAGVDMIILAGVDTSCIEPIKQLNRLRPLNTAPALALHPTEVKDDWKQRLNIIFDALNDGSKYCAVGETGIDFYWDKKFEAQQMQAFDAQLAQAEKMDLPVIIHCRNGLPQALEVLNSHPNAHGVFHSFCGSLSDIDNIRRHGDWYFGINGIVTFKNSDLHTLLPAIGIDRIVTETDAPYLAPAPFRGKQNESALIPYIVNRIAQVFNTTPEDIDRITSVNARNLFNI